MKRLWWKLQSWWWDREYWFGRHVCRVFGHKWTRIKMYDEVCDRCCHSRPRSNP